MKDYTAYHACRHPLMCHWRPARTISLDLLRRLVSEKSLEKYMKKYKKYIEISPKITGLTKMQTFFYKHYCAKILCHPSFLPDLFSKSQPCNFLSVVEQHPRLSEGFWTLAILSLIFSLVLVHDHFQKMLLLSHLRLCK